MKLVPTALAALCALTAAAGDAALLALTPAGYDTVIAADVPKLMGNRDVRALFDSPGMKKSFSELERAGVRVADLRALAVFSWDDCWYAAMRLDAAKLRKFLELRCADPAANISAETVGNRRVYRLKRPVRPDGRHRKKELCLTVLDGDTALFAKFIELEKFLAAPRIGAPELSRLAAMDADLWIFCRKPDDPKKKSDSVFDVTEGSLELRLAGVESTALGIAGTGTFSDPEKARSMSMTLPGILAFFAGLIFAEDPGGGDMVVRALRSEVNGRTMRISLDMSEELFRRFLKGLESFEGRKNGVGGAAGGVRQRKRSVK